MIPIFMSFIFKKVQETLSYQFSLKPTEIQLETKIELELGADSRDLLEMMVSFENVFNIEIAYEDISDIITVQDLLFYLKHKIQIRDELYQNLA
uniref:Acyl carrier protein n=1 Tax=Sundstroemia setigera TaxID=3005 RepID=A0A2U9NMW6_9STRA|nr:acyl carrier protein [Rhizosolenia setigera]YP_009496065.1 acyl carrier protein [Rhizosolenia setigera]AWT38448.1 acyl carrier protein [Rhizosolenia setigera]AWT38505.1 acyl carrier protein [Rhizosolenia setigera]